MVYSSDARWRCSYRLVLCGILAGAIGNATPSARAETPAAKFASIGDPPRIPPTMAYSLDPKMKPITVGFKYRRNIRTGVVTLAPAGADPSTFRIVFDDPSGVKPPDLDEVKVEFTYQGQSWPFIIKKANVKVVEGGYEVDVTALSSDVVNWIANRTNWGLDPYNLPKDYFTITDVKFTVVPNGGVSKPVDPGGVKPQVTFKEKN